MCRMGLGVGCLSYRVAGCSWPLIIVLIENDSRSCQSLGRGKVPVENRAPTADAAMVAPFDFDYCFD